MVAVCVRLGIGSRVVPILVARLRIRRAPKRQRKLLFHAVCSVSKGAYLLDVAWYHTFRQHTDKVKAALTADTVAHSV